MTTRDELTTEAAAIATDLRDVQERFATLVTRIRALPGGELVWQRIEAYPGIRLDRDMGAGQDALGWIEEVTEFLDGEEDEAPWPEDLAEGERIGLSGPGGSASGVVLRVSADRFTYRADDGIEREVHDGDGVRIDRLGWGG